jgi:hypothetical protein
MNSALVEQIANAVLYEGYMLYPYRASSVKNRQRWTFGGLHPRAYSMAGGSTDPWMLTTECVLLGGERTRLRAKVRCLHLLDRLVGQLDQPLDELPATGEPAFRLVESLRVGDRTYHAWQEAVEREVLTAEYSPADLVDKAQDLHIALTASRTLEALRDPTGAITGVLVRQHQAVDGLVWLSARAGGGAIFTVTVLVMNLTAMEERERNSWEEALRRSLVSTHAILTVQEGEFVSLLDPPEHCRAAVAGCQNLGAWPVLVGDEGEKDAVLCSPIILYDYPQIAPESPGDLFDATEIDEILTLRILTLTDEEKKEMMTGDDRARSLLARTEALSRDQLARLHGTVRSLRPLPRRDDHA